MIPDGKFNSILVIHTYFPQPYFLQNNGPFRVQNCGLRYRLLMLPINKDCILTSVTIPINDTFRNTFRKYNLFIILQNDFWHCFFFFIIIIRLESDSFTMK